MNILNSYNYFEDNYFILGQIGATGARGNDGPQGEEGPQGLAGLPGEMVMSLLYYTCH